MTFRKKNIQLTVLNVPGRPSLTRIFRPEFQSNQNWNSNLLPTLTGAGSRNMQPSTYIHTYLPVSEIPQEVDDLMCFYCCHEAICGVSLLGVYL